MDGAPGPWDAPRDLEERRRWAREGDSLAQRFARLQLERQGTVDTWSLEALEEEGDLAARLEASVPEVPHSRVTAYREGAPVAVSLRYQHGVELGPAHFDRPEWSAIESLELFSAVAAECYRDPLFARLRALRCLEHTLVALCAQLEAAGRLADAALHTVVLDGEGVSEEAWAALMRLPRLCALQVRVCSTPPPPALFDTLEEVGGAFYPQTKHWLASRSVRRVSWERYGVRLTGHREPGEKVHLLEARPWGTTASPYYHSRMEDRVAARDAGGHDDDRRKVRFHLLDNAPRFARTLRLVQEVAFLDGPRLLTARDRAKLAALVEIANKTRATPLALELPPLPSGARTPRGRPGRA